MLMDKIHSMFSPFLHMRSVGQQTIQMIFFYLFFGAVILVLLWFDFVICTCFMIICASKDGYYFKLFLFLKLQKYYSDFGRFL